MRSALLLLWLTATASAGVYHPELLGPFEMKTAADGKVEAVPLGAESFAVLLGSVRDLDRRDPAGKLLGSPRRRELEADLQALLPARTTETIVKASALMLVLRADERNLNAVVNLLIGPSRNPAPESAFLLLTHLAEAHAARGEWLDAASLADDSLHTREYPFPTTLPGCDDNQRAWFRRIENDYVQPWFRSRAKPGDGLDPLFVTGKPSDAIAIVQQLLLWHPFDMRLIWQLGELYAAEGNLVIAESLLDQAVAAGYPNAELRERRRALFAERERLRAAEQQKIDDQARAEANYWRTLIIIGAVVISLFAYWQFREVLRRIRRRRRPR